MRLSMTILVLASSLLLAACGFQLRGSDAVAPELQPLYIGGASPNSGLGQVLRQQFNLRGTELSSTAAAANYQLILLEHERDSRTLTLDPRANTGELALTERASFELRNSRGEVVLGPIMVEERRVMVDDPDRRVDRDNEASILRNEMLQDLAGRILRRLQAYQPDMAPASGAPQTD